MLISFLIILQFIPVKSYDLSHMERNVSQFEVLNTGEFLLYNKALAQITLYQPQTNSVKDVFFKNKFNKEQYNLVMLADDSFLIKIFNNENVYRYNSNLELIKTYSISDVREFNYFAIAESNKAMFFSEFDEAFILVDLFNSRSISHLKSDLQKHFSIKSPSSLKKNKHDLVIYDDKSIHYFDLLGRYIHTVDFNIAVHEILSIKSDSFILYKNGDLVLNSKILLKNVKAIRRQSNSLFVLLNKAIYKYDL